MTASTWSASALPRVTPENWREFACSECGAGDRRPLPPQDGLCHACRDEARERARQARLEGLRESLPHLLRAAGVPDLYLGFSRAAWEQQYGPWQEAPAASGFPRLADWPASAPGSILLLYGDAERATFLGTAVFGEALCTGLASADLARRREPPRSEWSDAADWLRELRGGSKSEESQPGPWRRLGEADLAMVSGLGAAADGYGELTPWARGQLGELIDYRRRHRRPTIVASRMRSWKEIRTLHATLRDLEVPLKFKVE